LARRRYRPGALGIAQRESPKGRDLVIYPKTISNIHGMITIHTAGQPSRFRATPGIGLGLAILISMMFPATARAADKAVEPGFASDGTDDPAFAKVLLAMLATLRGSFCVYQGEDWA